MQKKAEIEELSVQAVAMEEKVKGAERAYTQLAEKNKGTRRAIQAIERELDETKKRVVSDSHSIDHEYNQQKAAVKTFLDFFSSFSCRHELKPVFI